ncbi:putative Tetratricopeptide repeat protein 39C [Hypsibius exemplaris]|uniref:Tetratricopeptide repeat protein 39C n=1 Tax=Hypsibius exemplaris TaxID=2072580 RepID=A0A1W0WEC6_HYPEX|nr:putative Tetratricopeptide repeat protein 39C [Hypsibius exemplaris]
MSKSASSDVASASFSTASSSKGAVSRARRSSSPAYSSLTDVQTSARAIRYIFQARFQDANHLLTSNRNSSSSASLSATHSFVAFTQALVSYESDQISDALALWKQTEKLCSASKNDSAEDKLEQKVLLADAKICSTFLQLLQSADFGGLLKGSWALRQAWKLYQSTYEDLLKQIEQSFRHGELSKTEVAILRHNLPHPFQGDGPAGGYTASERDLVLSHSRPLFMRLFQIMGLVCYGFGCFHLLLSLLPGHLLKWLKFLGFEGDMHVGMRALTYCMNSPDSKSLLARMTLIWFHTVIQTYYAIDEDQMQEGIDSAGVLLEGLDNPLRASPLVQFFDCRLMRYKGNFDGAIQSYTSSLESSTYVKEINVLLHHEIGILRFHLQEWNSSIDHLLKCFHEGRWGKILYAYLIGLCYGVMKDVRRRRNSSRKCPA